jgi:hypothetical protein
MNTVFPRFSSLPQDLPAASDIRAALPRTQHYRQPMGSPTVRVSVADHACV